MGETKIYNWTIMVEFGRYGEYTVKRTMGHVDDGWEILLLHQKTAKVTLKKGKLTKTIPITELAELNPTKIKISVTSSS